jgi:predicted ATPase/class 3 adenylate cyclase
LVQQQPAVTTFLFTDIEGSTRLWDQEPERMRDALARHDALARAAIETRQGTLVKTTGDGVHAVFGDPLDAVMAVVELSRRLENVQETAGLALRVRCGLHAGVVEHRDNDYFGTAVNRAARIMSVAHGGQILVSQSVAELVGGRLPGDLTLLDLGVVRLRDLARAERLYQVVHPALRAAFPPLRSLESIPNNLPQQLTSFIGRERELGEIRALLRTSRLVTVTGTGGLGKTRLSLQVAADVLDDFGDGAWLVDLASLADARLVAQAAAAALGVKEDAGRSITDALVRHCHDRALLLVLDNCEHLIDACAEFAVQLLQSTSGVRILATSRERLNVRGERAYPLAPMRVPDRDAPDAATTLAQSDPVRLFIDRIAASQPGLAANAQNIALIAEICRRLDGIPLAIELAAARARVLPIATIAARLDDRFRLLTGGDRTALPRQQTLRALIDWSYELLSESERVLFRRLAVFSGGFTVEDAEAVASDRALPDAAVMDMLAKLVDKSLVVLDADGARYRVLETVREYARERLDESGEAKRLRDAHLRHYVAVAESAEPELFGPRQGEVFARLDGERENLLAAHAWCASAEDGVELGLRLAALKFYWIHRGVPGLGYRLGVEALARTRQDDRSVVRCRALFDVGQVACYMGRYAEGQRHLEESIAIARELGNDARIASALQPLAMAYLGQGNAAAAERLLDEALELVRAQGNKHDLAAALNAMAQVHRTRKDLDAALPLYEQVVGLARETGDRESVAFGLLNLAMASIARNANDRVPAILLEALAIADENRSTPAAQSVLEVSAGFAAAQGDWKRAARLFGVAEALAETTGLRRDPADEAFLAPLIDRARNALGAPAFGSIEAAGRAVSRDAAIAEVRGWIVASAQPAPV